MARPSKFTPEIQSKICQLLQAGNTNEIAAEASGISPATFYEWKRTKSEFAEAVEMAEAEAEAILVGRIARAASKGSWSAAAWLLERSRPDRWAKPSERSAEEDPPSPADGFQRLDELAPRRNYRAKS